MRKNPWEKPSSMLSEPPEWATAMESCLGTPSRTRVRLQDVQNSTKPTPARLQIHSCSRPSVPLRPPATIHHVPEPNRKLLFTESSMIIKYSVYPVSLHQTFYVINKDFFLFFFFHFTFAKGAIYTENTQLGGERVCRCHHFQKSSLSIRAELNAEHQSLWIFSLRVKHKFKFRSIVHRFFFQDSGF